MSRRCVRQRQWRGPHRNSVAADSEPPASPTSSITATVLFCVILSFKIQSVAHDAASIIFKTKAALFLGNKTIRYDVPSNPTPNTSAGGIDGSILEAARPVTCPVMRGLRRRRVGGSLLNWWTIGSGPVVSGDGHLGFIHHLWFCGDEMGKLKKRRRWLLRMLTGRM